GKVAGQVRDLPARVRDEALGPPRHRRNGVLSQGFAVGRTRGDGLEPRDPCRTGTRGSSHLVERPGSVERPTSARRTVGTEGTPVPYVSPAIGLVGGSSSARIGARWPAHEDAHTRRIDWRTAVVMLVGATALYLLPQRFPADAHLNQLLLFT